MCFIFVSVTILSAANHELIASRNTSYERFTKKGKTFFTNGSAYYIGNIQKYKAEALIKTF